MPCLNLSDLIKLLIRTAAHPAKPARPHQQALFALLRIEFVQRRFDMLPGVIPLPNTKALRLFMMSATAC